MKQKDIPWEVIAVYLKKQATDSQKQLIKDWLASSHDNPIIFDQILKAWQLTRSEFKSYQPNEEILWERLIKRITLGNNKRVYLLNRVKRAMAAAAVIIIIFLAGAWFGTSKIFNKNNFQNYTTIVAPKGSKTQITLPDSTKVKLNSGAELKYSSLFSKNNREVFIKGECFFDVAKSINHFTVNTSKLKVKVYGTKFNVKEEIKSKQTKVTLISGKVQVLDISGKPLTFLVPNEQLIYDNHEIKIKKLNDVLPSTAWINNILIFDNQSFEEVAEYLENWYGVNINLDKSLYSNHLYTFKVKTESLRELLDLISVITPIDYTIDGDNVTITKAKR